MDYDNRWGNEIYMEERCELYNTNLEKCNCIGFKSFKKCYHIGYKLYKRQDELDKLDINDFEFENAMSVIKFIEKYGEDVLNKLKMKGEVYEKNALLFELK